MIKSKISKFIAVFMAMIVLLSSVPVFAASTGSSADDTSIGEDAYQSAQTEYGETGIGGIGTDAYLTIDSSDVVVSVPTTIILSGSSDTSGNYIGSYSVLASGDISGDESLIVEPKNNTAILNQTGKDSVTASISQQQTLFLSDELSQDAETNGSVTATGLTAGSWTGDSVFSIRMTSRYDYYSSLELAATDANNLTTENADVQKEDIEHAVCGLFVSDGKAYIRMFNSEADISNVTFDVPVELNLDNNTLTFAEGQYLTYKDDFTAYNGTFISQNASYTIFGDKANTESNLSLSRIDFESTITSAIKSNSFVIDSSSKNKEVVDCNFNQSGTGSSSYGAACIIFRNEESIGKIINCNISMNLKNISMLIATQTRGNNSFTDTNMDINVSKCPESDGFLNSDQQLKINNSKVKLIANDGSARAIRSIGDSLIVNGGEYYCEVINDTNGCGINAVNGDLTINSTPESPVIVYGKEWGVQTSRAGTNEINGGIYTSTNHTGYILGSADIRNAKFYISNRDKYEEQYVDVPHGMYFGGPNISPDSVVNMYDCVVGNPDDVKQQHQNTIVVTQNYGNTAPSQINIYDCDLYQGNSGLFYFNRPTNAKEMITQINLYGNTHLYKNSQENGKWVEWSKDEVTSILQTWKDEPNLTVDYQTMGNSFVRAEGEQLFSYNADTQTWGECNLAEDANVYDYRS